MKMIAKMDRASTPNNNKTARQPFRDFRQMLFGKFVRCFHSGSLNGAKKSCRNHASNSALRRSLLGDCKIRFGRSASAEGDCPMSSASICSCCLNAMSVWGEGVSAFFSPLPKESLEVK